MPNIHINPNRFSSVQEYLEALKFTINKDCYVCGEIVFPCVEISGGFTPTTFAAKMKRRGWMPAEVGEVKWPFS